jgi:hypothetical protein
MRIRLCVHGILMAVTAIAGLTAQASPAAAQSFFDTLFGPPKPNFNAPNPYQGPNRLLPPGGVNNGAPYSIRQMPQPRRNDDDDGEQRTGKSNDRGGGYHTVCVRLCDGYYWPISYSVPRSKFYRDANVCSASCGSEAKLFHYPTKGGDMQDAVDLTGRVYSRIPAAFKYRKSLVNGCTCRPAPWSDAEMDRHRIYALNEMAKNGTTPPAKTAELAPPPQSGTQESVVAGDATDASAPEPRAKFAAADPSLPDNAEPAPVRKPARPKSAYAASPPSAVRNTARPQTPLPPVRVQPAQSSGGFGGFMGSGQPSKYAWPGDAPVRVR